MALAPKLSKKAQKAIVLPQLKSLSLILLSQLFDNDCKVLLDKREMKVFKDEKVIMKEIRNKRDSLWNISIQLNKIQNNYIIPPIITSLRNPLKIKHSNYCPNSFILKSILIIKSPHI